MSHRSKRRLELHVLRRAAEIALGRVAIGAAEVAFLGDRERKSVQRRRRERRVVDARGRHYADILQHGFDRGVPERRGSVESIDHLWIDMVDLAPVRQEELATVIERLPVRVF